MSTSSEARHWRLIDRLIVASSAGAPSLDALCRELPGVFPADVLLQLASLRAEGAIPDSDYARLRHYDEVLKPKLGSAVSSLPLPHPLDYEWRFTPASVDALLDEIGGHQPSRVALLGTPFVAERLDGRYRFDAVLYDRRKEACDAIDQLGCVRTHAVDLSTLEGATGDEFDVVVADPPWYPATIDVFVHAATRLLREGGVLLLCVPGVGTRPSVALERVRMTDFAYRNGLLLTDVSAGVLVYESPPFELFALRASGLPGFPADWRAGDRFVLVKSGEPEQFTPDVDTASTSEWAEVISSRSRVRVRTQSTGAPSDNGPLRSIVKRDVLDSVSRRDDRRRAVDVWTTTNAVYSTPQPAQLVEALEKVALVDDTLATAPNETRSLHDIRTYEEAAQYVLRAENERLRTLGCV